MFEEGTLELRKQLEDVFQEKLKHQVSESTAAARATALETAKREMAQQKDALLARPSRPMSSTALTAVYL